MRVTPVLVIALGAMLGCSSSDGPSATGEGATTGGVSPTGESAVTPSSADLGFDRGPTDQRVRSVSTDSDGDGIADSTITYAYDDAGRILSETRESEGFSASTVVTYQYEDGLLVTKTDGTDTLTYTNERGRVVAIEDTAFDERTTFEYDANGRLASFIETGPPDDDDGIAGEPFVPGPPTSFVLTVVRDEAGFPIRFDERDGGTVRFGRDAAGRLVSVEALDGESGGIDLLQVLSRDELGRVVGIDVSGEFELSVRTVYEADRLASFTLSRPSGPLRLDSRTELEYAADGLLLSSTTVLDFAGAGGAGQTTEVSTYEYESPACAPQRTNDPRIAILADTIGEPRASIAALECAYYLDDDF